MKPYKDFALELALQAGKIIRDNFMANVQKEWKADGTPVTAIDLAVNKLVIETVQKEYPEHSILAEEESAMREGSEYVWVCDPIDGTYPFSHGIPNFAFSLALVKDGDSLMGVAYDPMQDRLLFAEKGKGAFLNGKKVSVSKKKVFTGTVATIGLFATSSFYMLNVSDVLLKKGVQVLSLGSIVYSGILVATGEIIASTFSGKTAHDVAALKVIVEEAGGKVTDLFGNDQRYDQPVKGALFSNGLLHADLLEVIKEHVILKK